jgi:hypothetical protein
MKNKRRFRQVAFFAVIATLAWCAWYAIWGGGWKRVARRQGLDLSELQKLEQDKIVVVGRWSAEQVFVPYLNPEMPVFITSDSILNAYHVLLETLVISMEQENALRASEILQFLWKNLLSVDQSLRGKPELVQLAKKRAMIVLGTAIELLGDHAVQTDAKTAQLIHEEVERVEAASASFRPAWLGPIVAAIDYTRYRPQGFYDQAGLSGYFRAVSWLQSIPFLVDNDEQLLAMVMLGNCLGDSRFSALSDRSKKREQYIHWFSWYGDFLGDRNDWDLPVVAAKTPEVLNWDLDAGILEQLRQSLHAEAGQIRVGSPINDQITDEPIGLDFRVLSAYRTPDAVLFQHTTGQDRPLPSGLDVCVALGSDQAAQFLEQSDRERVIQEVKKVEQQFGGKNLYCDYLQCLSSLLDPPANGAPAFMANDAWKTKSCMTVLSGWTQLRHTWCLQETNGYIYTDGEEERQKPVGFVEPNPEFFSRLKKLCAQTAELLERQGIRRETVEVLRYLSNMAERLETLATQQLTNVPFTEDDRQFIVGYGDSLEAVICGHGKPAEKVSDSFSPARYDENVPRISHVAFNPMIGECLEAAIGHPHLMYVLYPTTFGEVLCRGVVIPYYEFSSTSRLSDTEWREGLSSSELPQPPTWENRLIAPDEKWK